MIRATNVPRSIAFCMLLVIVIIGSGMWGCPRYRVYNRELRGEATLREAQFDRQVQVEEAQAALDSASLLRQAELERALGAAEAMDAVSDKLTPEYLHYLWIQGLHDGSSEIIYVPTEANLPVFEASRGLLRQSEGR